MRSIRSAGLRATIAAEIIPPLVYTYPPRSAYTKEDAPASIDAIWEEDLHRSGRDLNLYIHIPFCRYRCGFCNLYTVITFDQQDIANYVGAVVRQLIDSANILKTRYLRTISFGGGTPSLLTADNYRSILDTLTDIYPNWRFTVDEIGTEASPDSICGASGIQYLKELRQMGFTRINIGVQSLHDRELHDAGRATPNVNAVREAIGAVRLSGIPNLSTDLIIGFADQTDDSWDTSIQELIQARPETVSTYLLTIRPDAWFERTGLYSQVQNRLLYRRYERARDALLSAGYVLESNIRYKIPGRGGLQQKVLQFRGVPVLGIGAGARSYTNTADYIVGGGHRPAVSQIREYIGRQNSGATAAALGFQFDDDERIRKRLALDLFDLHLGDLDNFGFPSRRGEFMPIISEAIDLQLLREIGPDHFQLTVRGYQYRDIVSGLFWSDKVENRNSSFYQAIRDADK